LIRSLRRGGPLFVPKEAHRLGDLALFETGAIVFHIAEHHAGLLPDDAHARARDGDCGDRVPRSPSAAIRSATVSALSKENRDSVMRMV
jgi:hypothetical protein